MLAHYRVPVADTEDLLQATLLVFCYKRNEIRDPEAWILATLKNRCRRDWRNRQRRNESSIEWLSDEICDPRQSQGVRQ